MDIAFQSRGVPFKIIGANRSISSENALDVLLGMVLLTFMRQDSITSLWVKLLDL